MSGAREERRDLNRIEIAIAAGGACDPRGEKIEGNGGVYRYPSSRALRRKLARPFSLMPLRTPRTTAAMDAGDTTTHPPDRSAREGVRWKLETVGLVGLSVRLGSSRLVVPGCLKMNALHAGPN